MPICRGIDTSVTDAFRTDTECALPSNVAEQKMFYILYIYLTQYLSSVTSKNKGILENY